MYFNEFVELTRTVTSELMFAIFDSLHQSVPCLYNCFKMRQNFNKILKLKNKLHINDDMFMTLPPPITQKFLTRLAIPCQECSSSSNGIKDQLVFNRS